MSTSQPQPPAGHDPLPVLETAAEVVRTYLALLRFLPRVALVPFTATFLAQGALLLFTDGMPAEAEAPRFGLAHLAAAVVIVLAYTMLLVDWHRLVLYGPGPGTTTSRLRLGRRDLRFLGKGLLVGVLSALAAVPAIVILAPLSGSLGGPVVPVAAAMLLALTAMMALGVVMPAAAVDKRLSLPDAFDANKRVLPRLLGLAVLILLPAHIAVAAVALISGGLAQGAGVFIPLLLVTLAVEYAAAALFATLLSVVYRRRIGDPRA